MSASVLRRAQGAVHLKMRVNGEEGEVSFPPYKTLLEVLREELGLTGTKHGCELGECGACAVLLGPGDGAPGVNNDQPVLSCLVLGVECDGRRITTVEGLATDARLHPLQETFADLGAAQCGYCTPGFLVTAKALFDEGQRGEADAELEQSLAFYRSVGATRFIREAEALLPASA